MSENLHIKHFAGGAMTPDEAHRKLAFGGHRCDVCGAPAAIRVRLFGEMKEIMERSPDWVMQEASRNGGKLPIVDFSYGKFIRISQAFACDHCRAELEKQSAKAPSWCIVEIDRGIPDKVQLQVPVQYRSNAESQPQEGDGK